MFNKEQLLIIQMKTGTIAKIICECFSLALVTSSNSWMVVVIFLWKKEKRIANRTLATLFVPHLVPYCISNISLGSSCSLLCIHYCIYILVTMAGSVSLLTAQNSCVELLALQGSLNCMGLGFISFLRCHQFHIKCICTLHVVHSGAGRLLVYLYTTVTWNSKS